MLPKKSQIFLSQMTPTDGIEYEKVEVVKKKKKTSSVKVKKTLDGIATYMILIFVAFVFGFPCIWLIATAFSKSGSIYSTRYFFPKEFSFGIWEELFFRERIIPIEGLLILKKCVSKGGLSGGRKTI